MADSQLPHSPSERADKELYLRSMALFDRVMARPAAERIALVQREAADDPAVCAQVLAMLAEVDAWPDSRTPSHTGHSGSTTVPISHPPRAEEAWWPARPRPEPPAPSLPGTRVGPYRILRMLNRGGMGEVYQAIREDHYELPVAIKVIRSALASPVTIERFRQERQILASLQHPSIAHILDGGSLPDGRPYLVMDFVDGLPVTDYCDRRRTPIVDRLALFDRICDAVQYAHTQLVIHRDIKPSNILVLPDGSPRLLDFGIAKLITAGGLSIGDLTTTAGAPSTPAYASPEQLRGVAVQTTSDVYLLGVLLYELLTGTRPFTDAERSARAQRELLPILPSQQFSGNVAARPNSPPGEIEARAQARGSTAARLARAIGGDLDAIVTNALRWDPRMRYQSVEALRDDMRRYREHHPVVARPRRFGYVARRFVRRHFVAVASGVLLALSLMLGFAGTFYQWRQAEALRLAAEQRDVVGAAFFESILDRVARALERDPTNTETQRGFMEQAAEYLRRRQAEAKRNLTVLKSVARGYGQVADLQGNPSHPNVGLPDHALENFDHSVQLYEYVRTSGREDGDALLGISVNNVTMGDIYTAQGDATRAKEHYQLAQTAAARLATVRQDDAARRQLALTESRLVDGFQPPPARTEPEPEPTPEPTRPRPARPPAPEPTPPPAPAPAPVSAAPPPAPDANWVRIPGGTFQMGCEPRPSFPCRPDEQPRHPVSLESFSAMAGEMSVGLFTKYAAAAGITVPKQPVWSTDIDLPIVGVSWSDAGRVCAAMGARLPTEAEWEYAARGGRDTEYPWGDQWEPQRSNYGFPLGDGHEFPVAASVFPANGYGLSNTVGNVWEWVADWYDAGYYAQSPSASPTGPATGAEHGIRGGSYRTRREFVRVARRGMGSLDPTLQQIGFRCVH
jgi:serine/threonine protein kinase/formylglycine-generating enzyme required for sulfatase activity